MVIVVCSDESRRSEKTERRAIALAHLKIAVWARWRQRSRVAIRRALRCRCRRSGEPVDMPVIGGEWGSTHA